MGSSVSTHCSSPRRPIGLLAGAILAVRVVPRLAEVAERILERRRGLVSPLGARQLARRPLRYTRSALLLMLAAALGTFALAHAATWGRSQDDQAAYQAATDVRIEASDYPDLEPWAAGSAIRSVPGVAGAEPIERLSLEAGRAVTDGELVALDPTLVPPMLGLPPDGHDSDPTAALAALAAGRPGDPGHAAPRQPAAPRRDPRRGPGPAARERRDTAGPVHRRRRGLPRHHRRRRAPAPARHRPVRRVRHARAPRDRPHPRTPMEGRRPPRAPLRLEAVEVSVSGPQFAVLEGTIDLTGIEVSDDDSGEAWTPVAFDPGATGWGWQRLDADPFNTPAWMPYTPPQGSPGRIEARRGGASGEILGWQRGGLPPRRATGSARRHPGDRRDDIRPRERRCRRRHRRGPQRRHAVRPRRSSGSSTPSRPSTRESRSPSSISRPSGSNASLSWARSGRPRSGGSTSTRGSMPPPRDRRSRPCPGRRTAPTG